MQHSQNIISLNEPLQKPCLFNSGLLFKTTGINPAVLKNKAHEQPPTPRKDLHLFCATPLLYDTMTRSIALL